MKNNVWYNISATEIAKEKTLSELGLDKIPKKRDERYEEYRRVFRANLAKARGIKYGVSSYSQMYMKEREKILGDWQSFFNSLCREEKININGHLLIAGINDGQEVSFLKAKHIIGVDISQEAIERGRIMYPKIEFFVNNLIEFTIDKNSIDTYLSLRTLHFFNTSEMKTILLNAFQFLKRGGKIIISVPGGFLTENGEIVFGQKTKNKIIDKEKPMKDALQIKSLLKDLGFSEVKVVNKKIEIFIIGKKEDNYENIIC